LGRVADLLAQHPRPGVGLLHVRGRHALGGDQRRSQRELQVEFVLRPRRGLGEGGEQRQACGQVLDGFRVRRALQRALPGLLPVVHRLCCEPCLRVMVRHQLGVDLGSVGKLRLQDLGNPLVVMLPCTL
jgi:hypothetical protein